MATIISIREVPGWLLLNLDTTDDDDAEIRKSQALITH